MPRSLYPTPTRIIRVAKHPTVPAVLGLVLFIVAGYLINQLNHRHLAQFQPTPTPSPTALAQAPIPTSNQVLGAQSKTTGCNAQNALPDPACTPGAIIATATAADICRTGYASSVRNVTTATKDQVYAEYGITTHQPGQYEVDHLISLELGGSNDIANLWPEAAEPRPGYHEKDQVENYLHDQVCAGKTSLPDAQHQIATNWLAVYNQINK